MGFPAIFAFFIVVVFLFNYRLKKASREEKKVNVTFWQKERESYSVRKQALSEADYLHPSIEHLCFPTLALDSYDQQYFDSLKNKITSLSKKNMMNFSQLTNTEIRFRFGAANQNIISENETNYNAYLKALAEYGKFMNTHNETHEAIAAYEECIDLKSEYSVHYLSLAGLYASQKNKEAFHILCEKASVIDSTSHTKIHEKLITLWESEKV